MLLISRESRNATWPRGLDQVEALQFAPKPEVFGALTLKSQAGQVRVDCV